MKPRYAKQIRDGIKQSIYSTTLYNDGAYFWYMSSRYTGQLMLTKLGKRAFAEHHKRWANRHGYKTIADLNREKD